MRLGAFLGTCLLVAATGCDRARLVLLPLRGAAVVPDSGQSQEPPPSEDAGVKGRVDAGNRIDAGRWPPFGGGPTFECSSDSQCGARRRICDLRIRRCVECVQPLDCPSPAVCDLATERCALPCQSQYDCSMSSQTRCDPNRHVCVGCLSDDQCVAPAPHCEPATGQCVECLDDYQCSPPWRFCAMNRNECVECLGDQHCPQGASCSSGRCVTR